MIIATDFDGTVANYGAAVGSVPEFNTALLLQWVQFGVTGVAVATNQGALGMGLLEWKTPEGAPYPSPSHFARRINEFHAALRVYGIPLVCVKVATYHTRVPLDDCIRAANLLKDLVSLDVLLGVSWMRAWRKPSPLMLLGMPSTPAIFYGDSDEDEQAAQAAGIPFVRVERFCGAKGVA